MDPSNERFYQILKQALEQEEQKIGKCNLFCAPLLNVWRNLYQFFPPGKPHEFIKLIFIGLEKIHHAKSVEEILNISCDYFLTIKPEHLNAHETEEFHYTLIQLLHTFVTKLKIYPKTIQKSLKKNLFILFAETHPFS